MAILPPPQEKTNKQNKSKQTNKHRSKEKNTKNTNQHWNILE
jgi:hypothetical protein